MKKKCAAGIVFLLMIFVSSCASLFEDNCPYLIANPHMELGSNNDIHNYGGAYFSLYNSSSKTIEEFTISFMLFDEEGKSPFIGSNQVTSVIKTQLGSGESDEFVVNLDTYLSVIPSEPYLMDYVFVKSIKYSDGTVWTDPFGMYAAREAEY